MDITSMDITYTFEDKGYQKGLGLLEDAQDYLETALADYRRQGYIVTEDALAPEEVACWNLNLNGRDVGKVKIVKGNTLPEEEW